MTPQQSVPLSCPSIVMPQAFLVCVRTTSPTSATAIYTIHNRYTPHSIVAKFGVPAWTGRTALPMNIVYVQNLQLASSQDRGSLYTLLQVTL